MARKDLVLGVLAAAILAGVFLLAPGSGAPAQSAADAADLVREFGGRLKMVSLLGPADVLAREMDEHYSAYVAPELIERWKSAPADAPGRLTSSPAPDRIEILGTQETAPGEYRVMGDIVETAQGDAAVKRTAVFTVRERNGKLLITDYGPDPSIPRDVALEGTYTCLQHRDTNGPQTLECALGIKTDDGSYYALSLNDLIDSGADLDLGTGERIRITGKLVGIEAISADHWRKYNLQGIVWVERIEKI